MNGSTPSDTVKLITSQGFEFGLVEKSKGAAALASAQDEFPATTVSSAILSADSFGCAEKDLQPPNGAPEPPFASIALKENRVPLRSKLI